MYTRGLCYRPSYCLPVGLTGYKHTSCRDVDYPLYNKDTVSMKSFLSKSEFIQCIVQSSKRNSANNIDMTATFYEQQ